MMTSLTQYNSPHPVGMQVQHPGMGQQGHPGMGAHPGQPHMQQMVSGPGGPQVSQPMIQGMPPGAGGPSAHALQHLNPGQQQMFQQQQQAMAFAQNPQLAQMQQQQQMIAHQRHQQAARQAMLAQQYSGVPIGMQNGMNQMTPAQFNAMRGGPMARPVNLPQHLQAQQAQAEHSLQQQQAQAQAQHQHQQQLMMAQQQLAMQQQAQVQQNPNQPSQMSQQQAQQAQQAQQQAHSQQQAHASQSSQPPSSQPQPQQTQPNNSQQSQAPQVQPTTQTQGTPQQQVAQAQAAMMQQRQGEMLKKGQCLMKLVQFGDHLSNFGGSKQKDDLTYWLNFVDRFFSPKGVLRHSVFILDENNNKQYEITYPALPRYFHTHFESGIKNIQMIMERGSERELPNNGHYIESQKSSFVYWFDNGSQLVASGTLKAHFDADQKIELLEFVTSSHEEYVPRKQVIQSARPWHEWQKEWNNMNAAPDGKQSPEMNKKNTKKMKSPNHPPPDLDLPESRVKPNMGITSSVFRFLEFAEVIVQMNPLFGYSHQHPSLPPYTALNEYIAAVSNNNQNGQQQNPSGPRTPGIGNFPIGTSPAQAHLNLPGGANSPHMGSPAQGTAMQHQQSQHGTSSSGPSANTSPNASNKRRRPSGVKEEDMQVNGAQKTSVKPSPRIGGKRQKGNPA